MTRNWCVIFTFVCCISILLTGCGSKEPSQTQNSEPEFQIIRPESRKSFLTISPWNLMLILADHLDPSSRADALGNIAVQMAKMGSAQQALAVAAKLDPFYKTKATLGIAKALVEVRDLQRALALVNQLEELDQARAFQAIAEAMAREGNVQQALVMAEQLRGFERAQALFDIASALAENDHFNQSAQILPHAMAAALSSPLSDTQKADLILRTANLLIRIQDIRRAREILRQAREIASKLPGQEQENLNGEIAIALTRAGDFEEGETLTKNLQGTYRDWVWSEMAFALAQNGALEEALALANRTRGEARVGALHKIAGALIERNEYERAISILEGTLEQADELKDFEKDLLIDISASFAKAKSFQRALDIAQELDEERRIRALREIALVSAEMKNKKEGFEILTRALAEVETRSRNISHYNSSYILYELGEALIEMDVSSQRPVFSEAGQEIAEIILNQVMNEQRQQG